jgi:hypothetical protein
LARYSTTRKNTRASQKRIPNELFRFFAIGVFIIGAWGRFFHRGCGKSWGGLRRRREAAAGVRGLAAFGGPEGIGRAR